MENREFQYSLNFVIGLAKNDFKLDLLDEETAISLIQQELIVQKVLQSGAKSMGFYNKTTEDKVKKAIGFQTCSLIEKQIKKDGFMFHKTIKLSLTLWVYSS